MNGIMDAFKAPFSSEAAARTTPAKTAVSYALSGFVLAVLFVKKD